MVNTNYSSTNNNINNSSLQAYSAFKTVQANTTVQNESTYNANDTAVILTLSSQAKSVEAATYDASNPSILKIGSRGTAVKKLQENLTTLGYKTNETNGFFNSGTRNAVIAFQKAYGLKADGIVGSVTQKAITKALDYHKRGILTTGSRGYKVANLQGNLKTLGYYDDNIDGIFGSGTKKAIVEFQKAYGLTADGIVGSGTKAAIEKAIKNKNKGILSIGSRGENVKTLQSNLKTLGYLSDKPDGIFGNNTRKAVISFQKAYGLTVNGIVNSTTERAIAKAIRNKNKGILTVGSRGEDVKTLQSNLRFLGYLSGKPDGIFGNSTKKAVIAFQKSHKLNPDGIVGSETKNAIKKELSNRKKNSVTPTNESDYKSIKNGKVMTLPEPGETIEISLGIDKKSQKAKVSDYNAWSIEYSIEGCRKNYPKQNCTKRLNYVLENYSYNKEKKELLEFSINNMKCYAGAMIEGFGTIGDVAEITLDDGTKFNFLILDTKSNKHNSIDLQANSNSSNPQCQNEYGHGYLRKKNTEVQLNVCEFIVSKSNGEGSATKYSNGKFLDKRYVTKAKIIGHVPIEENL